MGIVDKAIWQILLDTCTEILYVLIANKTQKNISKIIIIIDWIFILNVVINVHFVESKTTNRDHLLLLIDMNER